jgi:peptidoglycan/LPS O-acetylase OafA/YrhL
LSALDPLDPAQPRAPSLDGLRGAAAVAVVAFHCFEATALPDRARALWLASPLGILVNGPGAVHLFFVLSGYVLTLTLLRERGAAGLTRYYLRRLFRIQPPYMAAVLFAWAVSALYAPGGRVSVAGMRIVHVAAARLPVALAFPSMAFGQLPVGWSLYVETWMSIIFPLWLAIARRVHPLAPLALGIGLAWLHHPWLRFLVFTLDFALGIALYLERARCARWLGRLGRLRWALWVLAALALIQAPYALAWQRMGRAELLRGHDPTVVLCMGLGSAMLVAAVLYAPALRRLFSRAVAIFAGRVSYSLYLVHFPVLAGLLSARGASVPAALGAPFFAIVLALSTALAWLGFRFVEQPAIRAGRASIRALELALTRGRSALRRG